MKKFLAVMLVTIFACFSLFATGCGTTCDDDDVNACASTYSACMGGCNPLDGGDCMTTCTSTYCSCLDDAGCDADDKCN